ncbi:hypothetical protein L1987_37912 [Smallanthus sonchifolius]|uniref:Uncharacterized protein n=1 Tax=Smallanthus sonchifolius TaxID=185202 RepID=A0ACB9HIE2_9ASTR|nr:hypothetical protein L1987_37912 [Smallanthus sonchifolius]
MRNNIDVEFAACFLPEPILLSIYSTLGLFTESHVDDEFSSMETGKIMDISIVEFLEYGLGTVLAATNDFSEDNKIGHGGFGLFMR